MSGRLADLALHGNEPPHVALITFTTDEQLARYRHRRQLSFPMLRDPDRAVYDASGLGRGGFLDVWGGRAMRRYWQILRPSGPGRLRDLAAATDDTRQLGADVVIRPDGRLAWGHWSVRSTDRPSVDDIFRAVAAAT